MRYSFLFLPVLLFLLAILRASQAGTVALSCQALLEKNLAGNIEAEKEILALAKGLDLQDWKKILPSGDAVVLRRATKFNEAEFLVFASALLRKAPFKIAIPLVQKIKVEEQDVAVSVFYNAKNVQNYLQDKVAFDLRWALQERNWDEVRNTKASLLLRQEVIEDLVKIYPDTRAFNKLEYFKEFEKYYGSLGGAQKDPLDQVIDFAFERLPQGVRQQLAHAWAATVFLGLAEGDWLIESEHVIFTNSAVNSTPFSTSMIKIDYDQNLPIGRGKIKKSFQKLLLDFLSPELKSYFKNLKIDDVIQTAQEAGFAIQSLQASALVLRAKALSE